MLLGGLLDAEPDYADGARVVEALQDLKESLDIVAASAQGLNELVPAHRLGVAALCARDLDDEKPGEGSLEQRREILHALQLELMTKRERDADIVVVHEIRHAQGFL